jgi:purine-binding chemotaxis protein CheW
LRARARALAHLPAAQAAATRTIHLVLFQLAHETYALESRFVREVYVPKEVRPLPCTPPFILGIANVRGQILSVTDLKQVFHLPNQALTPLQRILVLQTEHMEFGILVDAVLSVRQVHVSELQSPLPTLTGLRQVLLKGITHDQVIVLDGEKLLASDELLIQEEVDTR